MQTLTLDTATGQLGLFEEREAYEAFTEKFKVKLTTDDCYTPENVFAAVSDWVAAEYGLDPASFVRPFWPGGDFLRFDYPDGCVVVDNPPFSLRAQIVDFYLARDIRFFLFSPALTLLTTRRICHIATGVTVTYENGAEVPTSFVTNLEDCALRTAPALFKAVKAANDSNLAAMKKSVPRYEFPDHVVTAATVQRWCRYGVEYKLQKADCMPIRALDAMAATGKAIFGSGYLLSFSAAAEKAAAVKWALSSRELDLIEQLSSSET